MKKCTNCGREIPDDAAFCGFCGTAQPKEEDNHPEEETSEVTEPEETEKVTEEKPVEKEEEKSVPEEKTESVKEEPAESQDEIQDAESMESSESDQDESSEEKTETDSSDEIRDAEIIEPTAEEKETEDSEEKTSEKDESEKPEKKSHVNWKKISLPQIDFSKEDLHKLLEILEAPEEHHGIDNTLTWIILIFAWIANWVAFGSIQKGFFSLLIVLIGLIFLNWLTLKDHATFGETVRNSAEVIFTPSVLVLAGGLFIRNIRAGAEVYAFHSIFTTAFIGLFFLTAALILFILTVIKKHQLKTWQTVLILTIFVSLLFWYLLTEGAVSLLY